MLYRFAVAWQLPELGRHSAFRYLGSGVQIPGFELRTMSRMFEYGYGAATLRRQLQLAVSLLETRTRNQILVSSIWYPESGFRKYSKYTKYKIYKIYTIYKIYRLQNLLTIEITILTQLQNMNYGIYT